MTLRYSPSAPGTHFFSVIQPPVAGKDWISVLCLGLFHNSTIGQLDCQSNAKPPHLVTADICTNGLCKCFHT